MILGVACYTAVFRVAGAAVPVAMQLMYGAKWGTMLHCRAITQALCSHTQGHHEA
jgi:hypothetical protein